MTETRITQHWNIEGKTWTELDLYLTVSDAHSPTHNTILRLHDRIITLENRVEVLEAKLNAIIEAFETR